MTSSTSRGVFTRLLRRQLDRGSLGEIKAADSWVDQALEHLESDEPTLRQWLEKDLELNRALKANMTAIYQAVVNDAGKGQPFERSLERMNQLIFRVVSAAVWHSAIKGREGFTIDSNGVIR